jgi:hypothetical protein
MGLAGFSHDFGAVNGKRSTVGESLTKVAKAPVTFIDAVVFLLSPVLPIVSKLPSEHVRLRIQMAEACGKLARQLLANVAGVDESVDAKSILGLLSNVVPFVLHAWLLKHNLDS